MPLKSKSSVDYRLGGKHCHACMFFIEAPEQAERMENNRCKRVEGRIGEHMVCDLFKRAQMSDGVDSYVEKKYGRVDGG